MPRGSVEMAGSLNMDAKWPGEPGLFPSGEPGSRARLAMVVDGREHVARASACRATLLMMARPGLLERAPLLG